MPNHYHMLIRQESDIPISRFINSVFIAYSLALNIRQERTGTLFEGRYKAIQIEKDSYLFQLCRYIHLNPVAAGLVERAEDWPYSNYREWINMTGKELLFEEFIKDQFTDSQGYHDFVEGKDEYFSNDLTDYWIDRK
jgi:putative transposase